MRCVPDQIHPSLWRANQLAGSTLPARPTGHAPLDAQLPGGGWPLGGLTELFCAQAGIGELRLLAPALARLDPARTVVLLQPPYMPNSVCCAPASGNWLWITPTRPMDACWAAEQILKNGSCGALLYWQAALPASALRRLHLAAQGSDMLFFMLRPLAQAQQASPAPLRLRLRPAVAGVHIDIVKRRGPALNDPVFVGLTPPAHHVPAHAPLDRPAPAPARSGRRAFIPSA